MRSAEYRILEYARSEDEVNGVSFLVVLRLSDSDNPCLRAYALDTWKRLAADVDDRTVQDLEDFVYDLRRRLVADRSAITDGFFDAIGDLNIGPLRTSQSGSFSLHNPDELPFFFPDRPGELVLLPQQDMTLLLDMFSGLQS